MKLSALLSLASTAMVLAVPVTNNGAPDLDTRAGGYGNYGKYGAYAPYTSYKRDVATEEDKRSGYGNYGKYGAVCISIVPFEFTYVTNPILRQYAPYTSYKRDAAAEEDKRSGYGNYGKYGAVSTTHLTV